MSTITSYSPFFTTIYDEPQQLGKIGGGSHYSILRCSEWTDQCLERTETGNVHDLCVIWDSDHDTRIIEVLETIYMKGGLSPVLFVAERKGGVTFLLNSAYTKAHPTNKYDWSKKVREICKNVSQGDHWSVDVAVFNKMLDFGTQDFKQIIPENDVVIESYLRFIDSNWNLGVAPYFKYVSSFSDEYEDD